MHNSFLGHSKTDRSSWVPSEPIEIFAENTQHPQAPASKAAQLNNSSVKSLFQLFLISLIHPDCRKTSHAKVSDQPYIENKYTVFTAAQKNRFLFVCQSTVYPRNRKQVVHRLE